jgi:AGZA family xanthine/uracil permease-like MFS transporter
VAALFGSCFPTTIYIGHPGWKGLGARIGYSWLDGGFMALLCLSGCLGWLAWAVPIEAGMAIVLWIGIVIAAQAFQATPRAHAPAVVIGLLPGIAGWGALMTKAGVRAAEGTFGPELGEALTRADVYADGMFALEQGFIFSAMILAGATVVVIEGRFRAAAAWCGVGAVVSALGLMHSWTWTPADTVLDLGPNLGPVAMGYAAAAVIFAVAPFVGARESSVEEHEEVEREARPAADSH